VNPNDVYKTHPRAGDWISATLACGKKASGIEIGKPYFIAYASKSADDMYPLVFPYARDGSLLVAVAFHAVPPAKYQAVSGFLAGWKAEAAKKGADTAALAKTAGAALGAFTRKYSPALIRRAYLIADLDKAYGLWIKLASR
jgi:hypothetical protein